MIEEIDKYLLSKGFDRVSMKGGFPNRYINKLKNISINVSIDNTMLSEKDEEIIKNRLRELGYLDDE